MQRKSVINKVKALEGEHTIRPKRLVVPTWADVLVIVTVVLLGRRFLATG